jgi:uncharacterized SAM-binding protein YcdF (DUF218 family)
MGQFLHGSPRATERRCGCVIGVSQSRPRRHRGLDMALTRVVGRLLLGLALVAVALGFAAFDSFSIPSEAEVRRASAAVVFTGAFERVDAGLQLVHSGVVPRLYVSGLNANAGILPARFVSQFSVRNPNIADLRRLVECCVEWGELADNTFQNAQDTKCWADRRGLTGPLLLITSRRHMARAMAALSGALPGRALIPYPADDALAPAGGLRGRTLEYIKYLGTLIANRLPSVVNARRRAGPFAELCPATL